MRVTVFGLWHLGCVTASCLAEAGHQVVGLDLDTSVIDGLKQGRPPLHEPGLRELVAAGLHAGTLSFSSDADTALRDAEVLWVTFDTPVNDDDEADVAWVRGQLDAIAGALRPGTLVLISSQVPVGFTGALERDWAGKGLAFACSPENLRLGKALDCFRNPERVVVGSRDASSRETLRQLLRPFCENVVWMSVESAEMTKHAVNAFLAASVTFINELARICEAVGADAKEVERGLKSEGRIGPKAYLSPGAAFAGGTLARDIRFLLGLGEQHNLDTSLFRGVWESNREHKGWVRACLSQLLTGLTDPVVAVLGLTYKPGTDTLRRSGAVELCAWLHGRGVRLRAFDPAVRRLLPDLDPIVTLCDSPADALSGADVAVLATEWPDFKQLRADQFAGRMRRPQVIDQTHFLAASLAGDARINYWATGRRPLASPTQEKRRAG
jgi:UDPglucose 6-dehydrogenase